MSPRTAVQNEEIRAQTRSQILDSAFRLFAAKGYEKTSIAQIASAAGVSKGLVYAYFDSKLDLLKGLFEQMSEHADFLFVLDLRNPRKTLKTILDQSFSFFETQPELSRMMTMLALQKDAMEEMAPMIEAFRDQKIKLLQPLFEKLGYEDPEGETYLLGALLDGAIIGHLATSHYPYEKMKRKIYKTYNLDVQNEKA